MLSLSCALYGLGHVQILEIDIDPNANKQQMANMAGKEMRMFLFHPFSKLLCNYELNYHK